ncbi:uncharacterized protein LOC113235374 [Hyposmocoma kahamanoa]|uniref:uncharacterized protein LOC113235374 n=1 Tax=Hyposmocoma kahamanoa TaxID=1477025 RepID=UPI000E6D8FCA|nr:uncharacterized protein LOC113235374 [Hyposmocoma kahamanoa]
MSESPGPVLERRKLPKLHACMTKQSIENMRNKLMFNIDTLDAKGVRRCKMPLYQCLVLELKESGFVESSNYLQNLLYDNAQLVAEDDIGIVVDLRKKEDFLEIICDKLVAAEKEREKEHKKQECLIFLQLGLEFAEKGKGILWLAEKLLLASIAVGSQYLLDGGRLKGVCKYYYAKFLLDKFPGADPDEAFQVLTEVRDSSIGKTWLLHEPESDGKEVPPDTLFGVCALQLLRVLLSKARQFRKDDPGKAERLARLAERRANDAMDLPKTAEAIIEVGVCQLMMNNLNNALKTFERAMNMNEEIKYVQGMCETRMHLAAVMQRLGDHEKAAQLLTEMGQLAMDAGLSRHLGRALHLLGELHLRREKPELGTQHLAEAFTCFMGIRYYSGDDKRSRFDVAIDLSATVPIKQLYESEDRTEIFYEEAEQSRLMMAVSAGQELMASYFNMLKEGRTCAVAKVKIIEWKLSGIGWWINRKHHDRVPCPCAKHHRSPLDILRYQMELVNKKKLESEFSDGSLLQKIDDAEDLTQLHDASTTNQDITSQLKSVESDHTHISETSHQADKPVASSQASLAALTEKSAEPMD